MTTGTTTVRTFTFTEDEIRNAVAILNRQEKLSRSTALDEDDHREYSRCRSAILSALTSMGLELSYDADIMGYRLMN